jgi:copper chaperone CopZ
MKTSVRNFFAVMLLLSISLLSQSYSQENKTQKYEVKIKTSAFSEMCKNRIETELKDTKGVLDAYLDLNDQIVTITYDLKVVKSDSLKDLVENLGYESKILEDKASSDKTTSDSTVKLN